MAQLSSNSNLDLELTRKRHRLQKTRAEKLHMSFCTNSSRVVQTWWRNSWKSSSCLWHARLKSPKAGDISLPLHQRDIKSTVAWSTWAASATWTVWCSSSLWCLHSATTCSVLMMASLKSWQNTKENKLMTTWCTSFKSLLLTLSYLSATTSTLASSASLSKNSMEGQLIRPSRKMHKSS